MKVTRNINHLAWNKSASQQILPGDIFLHRGEKKKKRSSFKSQALDVHHWQKHNPRTHRHFSVLTGNHFVSEGYSHFTLTSTALLSRGLFMIHSTMKTEFSPWYFTGKLQYQQKHSCIESWRASSPPLSPVWSHDSASIPFVQFIDTQLVSYNLAHLNLD